MIVRKTGNEALALDERDNFKAFKLQFEQLEAGSQPPIAGIRYIADDHAYIDQQTVIDLAGDDPDGSWRKGFDAMVTAAAKYGWIDAETQSIKAHIEWK
jgi:hypothetical protein